MAYTMYINDIVMPVMPSAISYQTANKNETIELISGKEINIPKPEGLLTLSFDLLLPGVEYPFAYYADGLKSPSYFLDHFKKLKASQKPFQLIIARVVDDPKSVKDMDWTNMKVTMEDYPIEENAENGFDIKVSVTLKQWEDYESKVYVVGGEDSEEKDENGEVIEVPTLKPLAVSRQGVPEGMESIPDYAFSTRLKSDFSMDTRGHEYLTPAQPSRRNQHGCPNLSLSGVSLDIPVTEEFIYSAENLFTVENNIDEETGVKIGMIFTYKSLKADNFWDIVAKRFNLTRAMTADTTVNDPKFGSVVRYGLISIAWAWCRANKMADPWQIMTGNHTFAGIYTGLGLPISAAEYAKWKKTELAWEALDRKRI
jgi:hypothetical protein